MRISHSISKEDLVDLDTTLVFIFFWPLDEGIMKTDQSKVHEAEMQAADVAIHAMHPDHEGVHDMAGDGEHHMNDTVAMVATVGVVAVGAAIFEAALIPGLVLGVAAALAPKYVPKMGDALAPMFRSSVRNVYKMGQKTREMMAEAKEHMNDIVAEVHAEKDHKPAPASSNSVAPNV